VSALLPFAQIDLPGKLPVADARYLVRPEGDPEAEPDVLAIRVLGAPRARGRLRRGRPVPVEPGDEALPLPLSRVTLIKARPFAGNQEAERWLAEVAGDRELWAGLAREAVATLNRGLHAHRTSTLDPYVFDVHPDMAVAIRFGYGSGEEVAEGRWTAASQLSERDRVGLRREIDAVAAQERIAAALGGREPVATAAGLLAEARRELDAGRLAGAALRLRAALSALPGGTDGEQRAEAEQALGEAEIALRAGRDPDQEQLRTAVRALARVVRRAAPR